MRAGKAQCYSGMLFACAALRELGHTPRLMWIDAVTDDGHCLALYQTGGMWGSIAKSNYTTLRSREPDYPYVALGLSYFEGYFNMYGKRTMRGFTVPVELEKFESSSGRPVIPPFDLVSGGQVSPSHRQHALRRQRWPPRPRGQVVEWGKMLYLTLTDRIAELPDDIVILAAHYASTSEMGPDGVVCGRSVICVAPSRSSRSAANPSSSKR
jgi:hypothetical protein